MKALKNYFALITGGSTGIGRSIAVSCARRGMNLILVALPEQCLDETAQYLRSSYHISVETYGCDLSEPESCTGLVNWIRKKNLQVNVLINDAGIGCTGAFEHFSESFYEKQIKLNVIAPTLLIRSLIGDMKKNGGGYIMNVGSLAGFFSIPFKDVYAATKSFVNNFSRALRSELKHSGIQVSVLCPGGVRTNKQVTAYLDHHSWIANQTTVSAEEVGEQAVAKMLAGKAVIMPGLLNRIMYRLNKLVPRSITEGIAKSEFRKVALEAA